MRIRKLAGSVPLAVGFGLSKPQHVMRVITPELDEAIIGSAFVKTIGDPRQYVSLAAKELGKLAPAMKKTTAQN